MLLMSVSDVVFTMMPDVTNMALPYCECGLSMTKSIPGMLVRMTSGPRCVSWMHSTAHWSRCLKPGVHTNDFAPIYGRRAKKLGHASLATVFRHSRLTFQPILRENLESPLLRYQPITTAVVTDACLNTRWHHGAYTSAVSREPLGLDRVVTVYVVQSAQLTLNCRDPMGSRQFCRVVNRHRREYVRRA